jgi:ABC-2 type transport system permease protein
MSKPEKSGISHLRSIKAVAITESRKALRSPLFLITVIGVIFMPMMLGLLMFIKKYPEVAHTSILLSKATMIPGNGDWHSFFVFFAQMICGAGLLIFGFVASWLFGREYSDRTAKDLLALPLPRSAIVIGKFMIRVCWCVFLYGVATTTALIIGGALHMSGWSFTFGIHCIKVLFIATLMNAGLSMAASFVACWARGYLAPIGFVVVTLIMGNFVGMLGFADYYPWGVPMLYAVKGIEGAHVGMSSIIIALTTACVGLVATLLWWRFADQN